MKKYVCEYVSLFFALLFLLGACGGGIRIEGGERSSSFLGENPSLQSAVPTLETQGESGEAPKSSEASFGQEKLFVHVCGSVTRPGVYALAKGARAIEAVESAGGFTEDAAGEAVNLARELEDGEKLYIPNREEALLIAERELFYAGGPGDDPVSEETKRINLNTASREELMSLPGIGEAKAEAIIEYRKQIGRFESIEEIMQISGIKSAAFEKIKDRIEAR